MLRTLSSSSIYLRSYRMYLSVVLLSKILLHYLCMSMLVCCLFIIRVYSLSKSRSPTLALNQVIMFNCLRQGSLPPSFLPCPPLQYNPNILLMWIYICERFIVIIVKNCSQILYTSSEVSSQVWFKELYQQTRTW